MVLKTASMAMFLINFLYKVSARMSRVYIKYSTCDLICDIISCCIWSCDMVTINVCDKIVIQNQKKKEKIWKSKKFFLH